MPEFTTDQWINLVSTVGILGILAVLVYMMFTFRPSKAEAEDITPRPPWLLRQIAREPVAFRAAAATVASALVAFGLDIAPEQQAAAIAAIIAVSTWGARQSVTPERNAE